MKECPTCKRTYADNSLTFCLADGALLSAPYDPNATQHLPISLLPTGVLSSDQKTTRLIQQKSKSLFIYLAIALLSLFIGGAIVIFFQWGKPESRNNAPLSALPKNNASPSPLPKSTPEPTGSPTEVISNRVSVLGGLRISLIYTSERKEDATKLAERLKGLGADVTLSITGDTGNGPFVGKIFYVNGQEDNAKKVATIISDVEIVVAAPSTSRGPSEQQLYLWLVKSKGL
jgi:hypothetical protein